MSAQLLKAVRNRAERRRPAERPTAFVRMRLRSVRATPDERQRRLPGDEYIPTPIGSLSHALTIRRPAHDVWPWIAQMGAGSRAGWYSYDFLDNGRRPSDNRIRRELQELSVGMLFPALPGVADGFHLLAFDPDRFLVLGWREPDGEMLVTWAFVLETAEGQQTRLVVRVRAGAGYRFHGLPWWASRLLARLVHFVMQRKQLLGIARRVERVGGDRGIGSPSEKDAA